MQHDGGMNRSLALVLVLVAACGSVSDEEPDAATPPMIDAGIDGAVGGFTIGASAEELFVRPGGTLTVPITVARDPGFTQAVNVVASGLPAGVTADALSVPSGTANATLTLRAAANAAPGAEASVAVVGHAGSLENG